MASMFLERLVQDENGKKQHSSAHEGTETKAPIRLPRKNQKRTPPETLKRLWEYLVVHPCRYRPGQAKGQKQAHF